MLFACLMTVGLIVVTVFIHSEGLHLIGALTRLEAARPRPGITVLILSVIALHLLEILIYAAAYGLADNVLNLGDFTGAREFDYLDYFYFSAGTFTATGFGDIDVTGSLRLLASIEPINGLILIAWSGAFTYLAVQRHWESRMKRAEAAAHRLPSRFSRRKVR
jgi:hypothetical protein